MPLVFRDVPKKIAVVLFCTFVFFSCAHTDKSTKHKSPEKNTIKMIAVGDNLIHIELIKNAQTENDDVYNFDKYYTEVKDIIEDADIAFINQETLTAGKDYIYSGYPAFNGPKDLTATIVRLGFDVVNHATNHSMDKGDKALIDDMKNWATYPDVAVLGVHLSQADRDTKKIIVHKNNISIGFLSYTYGLNGIPLPKDKPYLVSLIDKPVMAKEIDALRPLCDMLVVSMHWGNEYEHTPSKMQEDLANFLAEHNVDLVIGHHPHVLQPVRFIDRPDGKKMLVYFSLGNFISAQNKNATLLGGMMNVVVHKENGKIIFKNAQLIPLVTHYDRAYKNFKVYFLNNYTEDLAVTHGLYSKAKITLIDFFAHLFDTITDAGNLQK
ncbi:MAG: CapA family protein [Termitinemataceae bacterium]|nr:MAG: CapA family protein [Termitinemataceae bacterium]